VTLIYEALLTSLRRAEVQIEVGDLEGKAASLNRAGAIVGELLSSLDAERGGEIATALASLYAYFSLEIMNVGRSLDVKTLSRLILMVEELHGAWVQAAEKVAPKAPGSTRSMAASAA
jgi:flagellar protein FliS